MQKFLSEGATWPHCGAKNNIGRTSGYGQYNVYQIFAAPSNFDKPPPSCYAGTDMKSSLHPQDYRPVVFSDEVAGFAFLTRSTAQTKETITWEDGNTYPLVKVHISSASHPFFTGEERIVDTEGRVDRFKARMQKAAEQKAALANKAKKAAAERSKKAEQAEQKAEQA